MIDYSTDIGKIRLTIGDLDEDNFVFNDDQLQSYFDMYGNVILGAIAACRAWISILTQCSGDVYRIDTIEYQEGKSKSNQLQALLRSLEDSVNSGFNPMLIGVPITTGIYVADKERLDERIESGELLPHRLSDDDYDLISINPNQKGPYFQG